MPNSLTTISATHGLTQLIGEPTRVTATTSTLIDHVYTTKELNVTAHGVVPLGLSDHYMTFVTRKVGTSQDRTVQQGSARDWSRFDLDTYQSCLSQTPWHQVNKLENPNHMLALFYDLLRGVVDKNAPMRTMSNPKNRRPAPMWFDNEIKQFIRQRDKLKRTNDQGYRKMRNRTTKLIRAKKRAYTAELINTTRPKDTRKLWDHLLNRPNRNTTSSVADITDPTNGTNITTDKEKAECLNEHFSSIAERLLRDQGHYNAGMSKTQTGAAQQLGALPSARQIDIPPITASEVTIQLCKIPSTKATGLDGMSVKIIQQSLPHIAAPIATIINQSIQLGMFPQLWKEASVTPIHKGGNQTDPCNYRPISILPILSKVFERHIQASLNFHLERHNILHPHQSGFRARHSCETALMGMHSDWAQYRKERKTTSIVMLDFSKAFDVVDHRKLIAKLNSVQTPPRMLALLASYLQGRTQRVRLNNTFSTAKTITHGVPQGSILGPLLFAIYLNDLLSHPISSKIHAFADDTTLYYSHTSPDTVITTMNSDLDAIHNWCKDNSMIINVAKTKHMLVPPKNENKQRPKAPMLGGVPIAETTKTKLLGFTIANDLTWQPMISHLHAKAKTNGNLLRHLRHLVDLATARTFYHQYILPYLTHGITIWGNLEPKNNYNALFLVQKNAIRCLNRVRLRDKVPTAILARNTNILLLPELIIYHTASLAYKIANRIAPKYIMAGFPERPLRGRRDPSKLPSSATYSKLYQTIVNAYNTLPVVIRQSTSQASFRRRLRMFLL